MNFPFTEVDFAGEDPSVPIIPSANGNQGRSTSKKKGGLDTSQVTNSKVRIDKILSFFGSKYWIFSKDRTFLWVERSNFPFGRKIEHFGGSKDRTFRSVERSNFSFGRKIELFVRSKDRTFLWVERSNFSIEISEIFLVERSTF